MGYRNKGLEESLLLQAFSNVADTYGGQTKILLTAIIREYKRLEKYEESQRQKAAMQRLNDARKEFKATGKWPEGYGAKDDDIPF